MSVAKKRVTLFGGGIPFSALLLADYDPEREPGALGSISTLTDQRGSYNGTSAGDPQLVTDTSGKRAYEFDGVDDAFAVETLGDQIAVNDDYCIAVAVRPLPATPANDWLFGGSVGSASENLHFGYKDASNLGLHHWNSDISGTFSYSQNRLDILLFNQTVANGRDIYANSPTPIASGAYNALTANNGWIMGGRAEGSEYGNMRILRCLVYRGLTDGQAVKVYNWLASRYSD